MVLTLLKIIAGVVVVGLIAVLMTAVNSGLASSIGALRRSGRTDDKS